MVDWGGKVAAWFAAVAAVSAALAALVTGVTRVVLIVIAAVSFTVLVVTGPAAAWRLLREHRRKSAKQVGAAASVPVPLAEGRRDELLAGYRLPAGESLYSEDGRFQFSVGRDANLIVFWGENIRWKSDTARTRGACYLMLQEEDGQLVLYDGSGAELWAKGEHGKSLVMQSDGNLVLYSDEGAVWSSEGDLIGLWRSDQGQQTGETAPPGAVSRIVLRGGPRDGHVVQHALHPEDYVSPYAGRSHVWRRQDDQAWRPVGNEHLPVYDYVGLADTPG